MALFLENWGANCVKCGTCRVGGQAMDSGAYGGLLAGVVSVNSGSLPISSFAEMAYVGSV